MRTAIVAIDAGTTRIRATAVDETAAIIEASYRELTQYYPQPGWIEHDPEEIWALVQRTLSDVVGALATRNCSVEAIGITNQRETIMAWDPRSGRPLRRAIGWQDRRTAQRCRALAEAGELPLVRQRTGLVLDPYFSATKIAWLIHDGGLAEIADRVLFGTVDTWILWKLTGGVRSGIFATDPTNASRTSLYDLNAGNWSEELLELFGIPAITLADIRPTCGTLGRVAAGAVDGVAPGTPISAVVGDQQAALFGQACFETGMTKATLGTGTFVLANAGTRCPAPIDGLLTSVAWDLGSHGGSTDARRASNQNAHAGIPEGDQADARSSLTFALEGAAFVSGAAVQWLRDELGLIEDPDAIGPIAEEVPDSHGLFVVPAFAGLGSPWWDPHARGIVTGITIGTRLAHLARAVVESMAYQVRAIVETMTAGTAFALRELRVDGGASTMPLLLQLLADHLATTVSRPRSTETTALGAAMLAGLGVGYWSSLEELLGLWQPGLQRVPNDERSAQDAAYASWRASVERARAWA